MDDNHLTGILISLGICVVLPVMIVWLVMRVKINSDNKRTEVLVEAIRANNNINTDKLAEALTKPKLTFRETMMRRLLCGCIFSFIGLAFIIYGFICLGIPEMWEDDGPKLFFMGGCLLGVGISFLIVYFIMRRGLAAGEEAEKLSHNGKEMLAEA